VKRLIRELGPGASILDLGSGIDRRAPHVINLEIEPTPAVDVVADGQFLPFRDAAFDAVITEAVLEHVREPRRVVDEIRRVLRPGGYVCAAVPFLQGFHASPHDYQRYTAPGFDYLFADFTKIEGGPCAGPTASLHWISREYIGLALSFGNLLLAKLISLIVGWVTFPLVWLDSLLMLHPHAHILASAVYFVGQKRDFPKENQIDDRPS
jgi:SAM-dependent methyltransferase